ncbi:hypothetical protein [Aeromonas hydrophila]|uniref:hypothetical protein n=1 Tax=Aeromonas hydrophila TaxID=644 RepID=UPI00158651A3|nr:hypothetical protein [Aeromonas hydrophila]
MDHFDRLSAQLAGRFGDLLSGRALYKVMATTTAGGSFNAQPIIRIGKLNLYSC